MNNKDAFAAVETLRGIVRVLGAGQINHATVEEIAEYIFKAWWSKAQEQPMPPWSAIEEIAKSGWITAAAFIIASNEINKIKE